MGLFDGLFGGGYKRQANPFTGNLKGIASQYGQLGQQQQSDYNNNHAQYLAATKSWADILNQDRNDQTYKASFLSNAAGEATQNYNQGKAKFLAELQRNGMGQSGMAAGGLGAFARGQAEALSRAQNQYYLRNQEDSERRKRELAALYGNLDNQASGGYMAALGAQMGAYSGLYNNFEQQETQRQQEAQQRTNALLSLLSTAGNIYGMSRGA